MKFFVYLLLSTCKLQREITENCRDLLLTHVKFSSHTHSFKIPIAEALATASAALWASSRQNTSCKYLRSVFGLNPIFLATANRESPCATNCSASNCRGDNFLYSAGCGSILIASCVIANSRPFRRIQQARRMRSQWAKLAIYVQRNALSHVARLTVQSFANRAYAPRGPLVNRQGLDVDAHD
jgi:hypothetical protein